LQMIIFLGQTVTSYLFSFVISLAFEAPVVTMLRILTQSRKNSYVKDASP